MDDLDLWMGAKIDSVLGVGMAFFSLGWTLL